MTGSAEPKTVCLFGECMIELRRAEDGLFSSGFGGDTLNTAVYLQRLIGGAHTAAYVTVLGDDAFSESMVAAWRAEGLDCAHVAREPGASPGLYMIETDAGGERSFHYWRSAAPARRLFEPAHEALHKRIAAANWVYFSGISAAVLLPETRARMFDVLNQAKAQGARIAFDSNYRPRLWEAVEAARAAYAKIYALADIVFTGVDDEQALHGGGPEDILKRLRESVSGEWVLRNGVNDMVIAADGGAEQICVEPAARTVDATAAGDSFNAAYIAARIAGRDPRDAALAGAELARHVIGHPGAVIDKNLMPKITLAGAA